ncbi:MAG: hypothetical protein JWO06_486 [Bacteroidota bacterium]|nr:hypothetical protein [Bacteroidota bacterium]
MNYFDPKIVAERYARGRPDFHSNTIKHVEAFIKPRGKLNKALDVACGTGLSTKALLSIATNVYGTDISEQILGYAAPSKEINYSIAPAEEQPFADGEFDLITVSSGVHWFDIDRFLAEANRLLKSKGWLVLYENYFISEMEGNDKFKEWFPNVYLAKYPSPPRNNTYSWTNENLHSKNLHFVEEERFKNPIVFNKKQLALYFTTQSNIISAVENGTTTYAAVEEWLDNELTPFFNSEEIIQTIYYGNWIKFIQRLD